MYLHIFAVSSPQVSNVPWWGISLFSGGFALLAVVIAQGGALLLAREARRKDSQREERRSTLVTCSEFLLEAQDGYYTFVTNHDENEGDVSLKKQLALQAVMQLAVDDSAIIDAATGVVTSFYMVISKHEEHDESQDHTWVAELFHKSCKEFIEAVRRRYGLSAYNPLAETDPRIESAETADGER